MLCPSCQAENRDGAKFCDECGTRLESAVSNAEQDQAPSTSALDQEPSPENTPDATSVLPTAEHYGTARRYRTGYRGHAVSRCSSRC